MRVTHIECDPPGDDLEGEYVMIENLGGSAAEMTGRTLKDKANHVFTFPSFTLGSGGVMRVWTTRETNDTGNLYWGSGSAIWNNTGDCAYLRDGGRAGVSE